MRCARPRLRARRPSPHDRSPAGAGLRRRLGRTRDQCFPPPPDMPDFAVVVMPDCTGGGVRSVPFPGFALVLSCVEWCVSKLLDSTAGTVWSSPESGLPWPGTVVPGRPGLSVPFRNGWLEVVRPPLSVAVSKWSEAIEMLANDDTSPAATRNMLLFMTPPQKNGAVEKNNDDRWRRSWRTCGSAHHSMGRPSANGPGRALACAVQIRGAP